ncbi:LPS export ABC transporter periplasmic protein LptC [Marinomonas rhizomae]|uniref:Lipopolysaccharide export system protein LptC n=1 Tax=Marinomonas rhizomae TaxID=491948 RepID=A0A366J377_9GAMM|nr:LPS export ABC transporter periplasmic protein LptC [Marinomonas rhizomae]RBP80585.1 lipopolysaccharide export system protein LptC [Marinomonas rhizomae]RNF71816.1 LPS export ABC transporter periplasmic protein LptC [Marinomonas rhizomae]
MLSFNKLTQPKSLLLIGAALIISAFLGWYGVTPTTNLVETDSLSSSPDYFITKVKVKEFDIDGRLIEELDADQTLHYTAKSKTLLESPNMERYSKSGHWSAKADKGVIDDGSNDILLTENARATKKYLQSEDIKLSADNIHYLDQNKSLTSYGNATLTSTQGETSAGKITTYINSEEVVMTGSVRGKYETIH